MHRARSAQESGRAARCHYCIFEASGFLTTRRGRIFGFFVCHSLLSPASEATLRNIISPLLSFLLLYFSFSSLRAVSLPAAASYIHDSSDVKLCRVYSPIFATLARLYSLIIEISFFPRRSVSLSSVSIFDESFRIYGFRNDSLGETYTSANDLNAQPDKDASILIESCRRNKSKCTRERRASAMLENSRTSLPPLKKKKSPSRTAERNISLPRGDPNVHSSGGKKRTSPEPSC